MKAEFTATFEFNEKAALERLNLESGGLAQQTLDKAVIDFSQPYIPWNTGHMFRNAYGATKIGSGEVIWPDKYAHYQYYGVVYTDEHGRTRVEKGESKPINTGRPLDYSNSKTRNSPLAGPFWIEQVKANHMNQILKAVQNVIGK